MPGIIYLNGNSVLAPAGFGKMNWRWGTIKKIDKPMIGYKAAYIVEKKHPYRFVPVIVKIRINKGTRVRAPIHISRDYNKKRCAVAHVEEITDLEGRKLKDVIAHSFFKSDFTYRVGDTIKPKNKFCTDPEKECAGGIHFFDSIDELSEYIRMEDFVKQSLFVANHPVHYTRRMELHIMDDKEK